MRLKLRVFLLICLMAAAAFTAAEAWRALRVEKGKGVPQEIYSRLREEGSPVQFVLRDSGGYVAVYEGERGKEPLEVTGIEVSVLRKADIAMLELGIPVAGDAELLMLLEDLGS